MARTMNVAVETGGWRPDSWQRLPALQQPVYKDPARLARVLAELARLPPIVVSWEIDQMKDELAAAQRGAAIIRTHDVAETIQAIRIDAALRAIK